MFLQKFNLCQGGRFAHGVCPIHPTYGAKRPNGLGKMPPSLTKQFALNIYSKIRVQAILA